MTFMSLEEREKRMRKRRSEEERREKGKGMGEAGWEQEGLELGSA